MISVAAIRNAISLRHRAAGLAKLDGLPPAVRVRVQTAIARLPAGATVDLDKLVEEARRQAEREAQQRPAPESWRYFVTIASPDQLKVMRDELQRTGDIAAAMSAAERISNNNSIGTSNPAVEPDDEDEPANRPSRRTVETLPD